MKYPSEPRKPSLTVVALLLIAGPILAAAGLDDAKPSSYAPIADLVAQIEMFVEDVEDDLEDAEDYQEDQQNRVLLNSSTLIVLGQTIGMHDTEHPLQKAAPGLIESALELADNAEDFAAAQESLGSLKNAIQSSEGGDVDWEPTADLSALMKQVPIVNNSLRRGVTGRRFERMIDKSAGSAATLAAIAQASMFYTDYCADEEDEAKWAKICVDMRDAAAQVHGAVRQKDKDTAVAGLAKLVETCDACHHAFRD